ncbi:urease accessory protein UreD [Bradyrhizobium sp. ISRA435]|nr:urease accessory protein UreD [Bradyrhizobium sp. ISRA435]
MRSELAGAASATFAANRAQGAVRFGVHLKDGVTRRGDLHESGSLRVRFPSPEDEGLSAMFVNTAGGIAGGDRFDIAISAGEGARVTLTTAAAEKVYRAPAAFSSEAGTGSREEKRVQTNESMVRSNRIAPCSIAAARLDIALKADTGAHLAWLPQETILFDRARIHRRFDIDLADNASLLLCEIVVFGRAAMGETMRHGEFVDRWRMRRGRRLVFAETVRLDGEIGEKLARPAIAGGGTAIGTALIVPGDAALVERIREASDNFGGEVGISAWNGFAMVRFCAQDAARLRADMMTVLSRASAVTLPRLWLN